MRMPNVEGAWPHLRLRLHCSRLHPRLALTHTRCRAHAPQAGRIWDALQARTDALALALVAQQQLGSDAADALATAFAHYHLGRAYGACGGMQQAQAHCKRCGHGAGRGGRSGCARVGCVMRACDRAGEVARCSNGNRAPALACAGQQGGLSTSTHPWACLCMDKGKVVVVAGARRALEASGSSGPGARLRKEVHVLSGELLLQAKPPKLQVQAQGVHGGVCRSPWMAAATHSCRRARP